MAATAAVVDYLTERGHEAFAYVGYEAKNYWDVERLEGFRSQPGRQRPPGPRERHRPGSATLEAVHAGVLRLLARKRRPTRHRHRQRRAGRGGCERGQVLGLRVGQDVAVTGFDGGFVQQMTEPILTSVRIPVDRIAAELIRRCLREIDHGPTNEPGLVVPTELSVGGSASARQAVGQGPGQRGQVGQRAGRDQPLGTPAPGQPQLDPVVAVVAAPGCLPALAHHPGQAGGDQVPGRAVEPVGAAVTSPPCSRAARSRQPGELAGVGHGLAVGPQAGPPRRRGTGTAAGG